MSKGCGSLEAHEKSGAHFKQNEKSLMLVETPRHLPLGLEDARTPLFQAAQVCGIHSGCPSLGLRLKTDLKMARGGLRACFTTAAVGFLAFRPLCDGVLPKVLNSDAYGASTGDHSKPVVS